MSAVEMAYRHPKRGKSHRLDPDWRKWRTQGWMPTTYCGKSAGALLEVVPLDQTDPGDRCRTCEKAATS